jgi:hypothetical protein
MGFDWNNYEVDDQDEEDRVKRLMELTFHVAVHDEKWVENFKRLVAFKEKFGHFGVPSDESSEFQDLPNWVRHQRFLYKRNKLPEDRLVHLEGIDFAWTALEAGGIGCMRNW